MWRLSQNQINCSCGAGFEQDGFWRGIASDAALDASHLAELRTLEETVSRTGFIARHRFSLEALRADPQVRRFLDLQFELFKVIAARTGSRILVDSSKAGPRAWLLACDPRVRILHLYRDPRDVLLSWHTAKFDPGLGRAMQQLTAVEAGRDWWKAEQLARLLARRCTVWRMDYARLCAHPQATVAAAIAGMGLPSSIAPRWIAADCFEQGADYHSLNGNPDRFDRGPVSIRQRAGKPGESAARDWRLRVIGAALGALYPPMCPPMCPPM